MRQKAAQLLPKLEKELKLQYSYALKDRPRAQTHLTGRSKEISKEEFDKYLEGVRRGIMSGRVEMSG